MERRRRKSAVATTLLAPIFIREIPARRCRWKGNDPESRVVSAVIAAPPRMVSIEPVSQVEWAGLRFRNRLKGRVNIECRSSCAAFQDEIDPFVKARGNGRSASDRCREQSLVVAALFDCYVRKPS